MNLVPFAGIAFLWFVGVLRDRLGAREDQFFATLFLGSGFLLLSMLFTAAAAVGAIIIAFHATPETAVQSAAFHFRTRLCLWDGQRLLGEDGSGFHDHDIDHRRLHSFDASLACDHRI